MRNRPFLRDLLAASPTFPLGNVIDPPAKFMGKVIGDHTPVSMIISPKGEVTADGNSLCFHRFVKNNSLTYSLMAIKYTLEICGFWDDEKFNILFIKTNDIVIIGPDELNQLIEYEGSIMQGLVICPWATHACPIPYFELVTDTMFVFPENNNGEFRCITGPRMAGNSFLAGDPHV